MRRNSSGSDDEDAAIVPATPEDRAREMQHVLLALPSGSGERTELEAALASPVALSPSEMQALLDRLWERRQAELREVFKSTKNEAQLLQGLLAKLLVPPTTPAAEGPSDLTTYRVALLEDMEAFVASVHNAEDFTTMGGIATLAMLLNDTSIEVAATAAWVVGTAVKYAPVVQAAAVQAGVLPGLLGLLDRSVTGALSASSPHALSAHAAVPGSSTAGGSGSSSVAVPYVTAMNRAVYSLGSLLRSNAAAQAAFVRPALDGQAVLLRAGRAVVALQSQQQQQQHLSGAGNGVGDGGNNNARAAPVAVGARGVTSKVMSLLADLHAEAAAEAATVAATTIPTPAALSGGGDAATTTTTHNAAGAATVGGDGRVVVRGGGAAAVPAAVLSSQFGAAGPLLSLLGSGSASNPSSAGGRSHGGGGLVDGGHAASHRDEWCGYARAVAAGLDASPRDGVDGTTAKRLAALDVTIREAWDVISPACGGMAE